MTETTTSTTPVVDEQARFRAVTALGLALAALVGGGMFSTAFQWLAMKVSDDVGSDQLYFAGAAVGPLVLGGAALWLALTTRSSRDPLAGPLARASAVLAAVALAGAVLLTAVTVSGV